MLWNPKHDKEVKADPFSLDALIAWLEKQPAGQRYEWMDCSGQCLIDQYGWTIGLADNLGLHTGKLIRIFGDLGNYSAVCNGGGGKWTFGDALERARALATTRASKPE